MNWYPQIYPTCCYNLGLCSCSSPLYLLDDDVLLYLFPLFIIFITIRLNLAVDVLRRRCSTGTRCHEEVSITWQSQKERASLLLTSDSPPGEKINYGRFFFIELWIGMPPPQFCTSDLDDRLVMGDILGQSSKKEDLAGLMECPRLSQQFVLNLPASLPVLGAASVWMVNTK